MRYWTGVLSAFASGVMIGIGVGMILVEEKTRKEYEESLDSHKRVMEMSKDKDWDFNEVAYSGDSYKETPGTNTLATPVIPSDPLRAQAEAFADTPDHLARYGPQAIKQSDTHDFTPESSNPYHHAIDDPRPSFIYLTEEDFEEDDGRYKGHITILNNDERPIFLENGAEIRDWENKVGTHILRDMFAMIPPDQPRVLYIRNAHTDEDYRVAIDQP